MMQTDRWQPVAPASGRPTVMQRNLNTALPVTVLLDAWMDRWLQQLGEVDCAVVAL